MIPILKSGSGGKRVPRRIGGKNKLGLGPIIGVIVLLVIAAVAMVLITAPKSKKTPARAKADRQSGERAETSSRRPGRTTRVRADRKEQKRAQKQARRDQRRQSRPPARRTRAAAPKSEPRTRSTRSERPSAKSADSPRVDAIFESRAGERVALVNTRPLKAGDVFEGRRIVSVDAERVQVEFSGRTYSVRIGQNLF